MNQYIMLAIRLVSEIFTVCCDKYNRHYHETPGRFCSATNPTTECLEESVPLWNLVTVIILNSILDCFVYICENVDIRMPK